MSTTVLSQSASPLTSAPPTASRPAVEPRCPASLWLLIGLVLVSLLGMHFLSGHDSAGHHRMLTPAASSTAPTPPTTVVGIAACTVADVTADLTRAVAAPVDGTSGDRITVIGCALLLLVGLGTALSWWLRRRSVGDRTAAGWCALHGTLRGPPKTVARLVLCVERT